MAQQAHCPVCDEPVEPNATSCGTCGFKLEGRTEEFQQLEMDENGRAVAPTAIHTESPTLTIIKGPSAGETFKLTSFPLIAGRDPKCDLFLSDTTVRRKHASIDIIDGAVVIRDLNSLNGTWVDGQICDKATLADGAIVQIGTFTMVFGV